MTKENRTEIDHLRYSSGRATNNTAQRRQRQEKELKTNNNNNNKNKSAEAFVLLHLFSHAYPVRARARVSLFWLLSPPRPLLLSSVRARNDFTFSRSSLSIIKVHFSPLAAASVRLESSFWISLSFVVDAILIDGYKNKKQKNAFNNDDDDHKIRPRT